MLLLYSIIAIAFAKESSAQLFGRFGFDFPGFSAPEAFDNEAFGDIQDRISELMKNSAKPKKGIKTKVKTEHRGDENITTIEQKGKDFDSWARLTTFGDKKQGGKKVLSKMISGLFGGDDKGRKKSECSGQKPCKGDKFCDPIEGVCKDKVAKGERCFMKDQCKSGSVCLWGTCAPGKKGQSGTFCNKDKDCENDNYCTEVSQISIFQPICKPKLDEGASCGSFNPFGMMKIIIGKRDTSQEVKASNPCKNGLKCEQVGMFGGLICVPESLKINKDVNKVKVTDMKKPKVGEEEDEEESSGGNDGEDEKPDNEEGGDIVPSKEQKQPEEQATDIMNAKPGKDNKNDESSNTPVNGEGQNGQQKPPPSNKPAPVPALKPINGPPNGNPSKNKSERRKKNKKQKKVKQDKE